MKQFKFAITDNTTYTGKDAIDFYARLFDRFPSKEVLTFVPNVKSKIKLPSFNIGNILQDDDCTFSNTGEGVLDQKAFEVCPIKINLEYCVATFEQNFLNEYMKPGWNIDEVMPKQMSDFVFEQINKHSGAQLEKLVWQGDTGTASYPLSLCDGLLKKFDADSAVIDVSATASTLSAANIIGEITKVYDAIPQALLLEEDLVLAVSVSIARFYKQAIAAGTGNGGAYFIGDKELNFLGVRMVELPGLPAGVMVAYSTKNVFLFTDLVSEMPDTDVPRMIPQYDKSGAPTVRIAARFKFGVGYFYGAEIVYYKHA